MAQAGRRTLITDPPPAEPARPARHLGMDWLRIGAFGLLILYHIGMVFVPWDWHVKIAHPIDAVAIPMLATNSWRLPLLFLVSGYASAALYAKLGGPGAFVRSRSARLLIPLLFGIIVIIPPQPWIDLTGQHGYTRDFGYFWLHDYFRFRAIDGIVLPTWQHLWFVPYLWVYTLVIVGLLVLTPAAMRARIADRGAAMLGGWGLLVAPLLWWLIIWALFPVHDETHALIDDGPTHLHYLMPFMIGWLLRVRPVLFAAVARCWPAAAIIAMLAYALVAGMAWHHDGSGDMAPSLTFAVARLVQGWATIVALIGIADRFWNHDHRWRAPIAEAVFPFYIIHQTIIVVVAWMLIRDGFAPLPTFLLLIAATVTGCWLFYRIGREIGWLRPLIGLQRRA
jgi:surface polysaccharide O-acyltransferase-like enzyme